MGPGDGTRPAYTDGRSLGFDRLQHYQIIRRRPSNHRERNPCFERDESSLMLNRKSKEVYVRKLAWANNSCRVNNVWIQQADFIRPEFVYVFFTSVGKAFHDSLNRQCIRIARVRHDTHTPVLGDRTGSPTLSRVLCKPSQCDRVRRVIGVEQCNQYVNVQ
jgi:hypothetical protein